MLANIITQQNICTQMQLHQSRDDERAHALFACIENIVDDVLINLQALFCAEKYIKNKFCCIVHQYGIVAIIVCLYTL